MPPELREVLTGLDERLARIEQQKRSLEPGPDRAVLPGASPSLVEHVAKGGSVNAPPQPNHNPHHFAPSAKGLGRGAGLSGAMTKALAEGTGSAGGFLVEVQVAEEIRGLIRARSAIDRLGPTVVEVEKELAVTSIASGSTAYYVLENAHVPVSEPTFAQAPLLIPKELAALVPVSNRLLRDAAANPSVEAVLRSDLAEVLALRQDLAFLQGTGGSEPLGVRNWTGLTPGPDLGANGRAPNFDDLYTVVAGLRSANAPFLKPGWVMAPRTLSTLERIKTSTGEYLGETGLLDLDPTGGTGTLLGFPFFTTTQIPTTLTVGTSTDASYLIFSSDWEEAWIGENLGLEVQASGDAAYTPDGGTTWISAYQARQTLFRAVMAHDFALRRANWFTVMHGVRP